MSDSESMSVLSLGEAFVILRRVATLADVQRWAPMCDDGAPLEVGVLISAEAPLPGDVVDVQQAGYVVRVTRRARAVVGVC